VYWFSFQHYGFMRSLSMIKVPLRLALFGWLEDYGTA